MSAGAKELTDWREGFAADRGEEGLVRRDSEEGSIEAGVIVCHCWFSCLAARSVTAIVRKAKKHGQRFSLLPFPWRWPSSSHCLLRRGRSIFVISPVRSANCPLYFFFVPSSSFLN